MNGYKNVYWNPNDLIGCKQAYTILNNNGCSFDELQELDFGNLDTYSVYCELKSIELSENELYDMLCNMYSPIQVKFKDNEDEFYTIAHDMFMDNVAKMELKYPFLKDYDNDGELWYDSIREDVMNHYMTKMSTNL